MDTEWNADLDVLEDTKLHSDSSTMVFLLVLRFALLCSLGWCSRLWLALAVTAHQVDCFSTITTEACEDTPSSTIIILGSSWSVRCLGKALERHLPLGLHVLRITPPCTLQSPMTTTFTVLAPRGGTFSDCHSPGGSHTGFLRCSQFDVCPDCQRHILSSVLAPRRLLSSDCYRRCRAVHGSECRRSFLPSIDYCSGSETGDAL